MSKARMEAFSDGVIAIIITIMVLELATPEGDDFRALTPLLPVFLAYVLSFIFVGIYWNNHHHMLHAVDRINGRILWANNHLLFWLSLTPFVTGWLGHNHVAAAPTAAYGVVQICAAFALLDPAGRDSRRARAAFKARKGGRQRRQGKALARALCRRDRAGVRQPVDLDRHLHHRCGHVAHPG